MRRMFDFLYLADGKQKQKVGAFLLRKRKTKTHREWNSLLEDYKRSYWATALRCQHYMMRRMFDFLYLADGKEKQKVGAFLLRKRKTKTHREWNSLLEDYKRSYWATALRCQYYIVRCPFDFPYLACTTRCDALLTSCALLFREHTGANAATATRRIPKPSPPTTTWTLECPHK